MDENEILSRWREYLEDLLNPVNASNHDSEEVIHLWKEEVFTTSEVATAIKGIKSGKAAGKNEIRRQMFKTLTGEKIIWLRRVCQVSWKYDESPRDWQTGLIIPKFKKKEIASNVRTTEEHHFLVCQEKYMPNALKGNAEK